MSHPGQPGEAHVNPFAAGAQSIRAPQQRAARLSAWGKFSQFALGIELGSLPLAVFILTGNIALAIMLYVAVLVLSFVVVVRRTYNFVGFGMLASDLASPIIAVISVIVVSFGRPQG